MGCLRSLLHKCCNSAHLGKRVLELSELHLGIALYTTVVYSTSKVLRFIALYSSSELREIYGAVN